MAKTGRPRTEYAEKMGPVNHNGPLTRGGLDALRAISVRQAELGRSQPHWMIVEDALYRKHLEVEADPKNKMTPEQKLRARYPEYFGDVRRDIASDAAERLDRERILRQKSA